MRVIKATKTRRYADSKAYMPQRALVEGVTYKDLSSFIIDNALRSEGAVLVESEIQKKVVQPKSKEKRKFKMQTK